MAVPARRDKTCVSQPDGTVLTVMARGDESFHYLCTEDGKPVVLNADKVYCYACIGADGVLHPTAQVAHDVSCRTMAEKAFLEEHGIEIGRVAAFASERAAIRNAERFSRVAARRDAAVAHVQPHTRAAGAVGGDGMGVTGKRKGLVILVDFKDVRMQTEHGNAAWNDFFNKAGYDAFGNSGSVHDYFYAQSYGQFDLSFDVVGPVSVSRDMAYYGGNDTAGNDSNPAAMVYEACRLADPLVDFADYDWDGDGCVDQVFVVYAGYGEASKPSLLADAIWPHEWTLGSGGYSLTLDKVKIDTYGCAAELYGYSGTKMAGIGTACHEFSHCLGLPDIYDTSGGDCFGMDMWDVMDYGSYGGDGYRPVGYNTYERWVSGWMQPDVLDRAADVYDMPALGDSPKSYIVYNDKRPSEYYIFENRQQKGFDTELPSHGMLVIHVDYSSSAWDGNEVNTVPKHPRFGIVAADGDRSVTTLSADTYPGTSGNASLTDTSSPRAELYNANSDGRKLLGKPVTAIAESQDGLVSFLFMGGCPIVPSGLRSEQTGSTSCRVSWDSVEYADCYNLQFEEVGKVSPEDRLLLAEDFAKWGSKLAADSKKDVSASLDAYMSNKGWTGSKVYEGVGRVKIGTSASNIGNLVSPEIDGTNSSKVTVCMVSDTYGTDKPEIILTLVDSNGDKIDAAKVVPDGKRHTVVFSNAQSCPFRLMVQPAKRCYLYSVAVYDGGFSDSDFVTTRAVGNVGSVDGIDATEYEFLSLQAGVAYRWRVQAVKRGEMMPWSDWYDMEMSDDYTGIVAVPGTLCGMKPSDMVSVYLPCGVLLGRMSYGSFIGDATIMGTYILKFGVRSFKMVKGNGR